MTTTSTPERLATLDAMRGLAAVLVLLYHFRNEVVLAPSGYLAVDFFFLLSGLVIARTYAPRFARGMGAREFVRLRLIRLYPLFAVGLLIGGLRAFGQTALHMPQGMGWSELAMALASSLLMMPTPQPGLLFPINGPAWSLHMELLANLAFAVFIVRASTRQLAGGLLLLGAALVALGLLSGRIDGGQAWSSYHGGLIRVMFSFTLGVAFARLDAGAIAQSPRPSLLCVLPALALCASLLVAPPPALRPVYDIAVVMLLYPAIVWLGARFNPPAFAQRAADALGEISYPLYITHYPLLYMAGYGARKLGLAPVVWIPAFVVGMCLFAWGLARWVDPGLRRWLASGTGRRQPPQAPLGPQAEAR